MPTQLIDAYLDAEIDPAYAARARFVLSHCIDRFPKNLLDIGCGRGFYLSMLSQCDFLQSIVGIDSIQQHARTAKELCNHDPRVQVLCADGTTLPFPSQHFDFVICSEVLEHLTDPQRCIQEIHRVTKPGGWIAVTVPRRHFPFAWDPLNFLLTSLFGVHISKDIHWLAGIWADHERLYEPAEIMELVAPHFELQTISTAVQHCIPFSHFLIYGIGKTLIQLGFFQSFSRFSDASPSRMKKHLASLFCLPSRLFDRSGQLSRSVTICLLAQRPS